MYHYSLVDELVHHLSHHNDVANKLTAAFGGSFCTKLYWLRHVVGLKSCTRVRAAIE